ncbi:TIGR04282 family arsenosugar biosynthesis glycosyltransferase [Spartinivicinus ruber]|uniref:TIGR04282 family arsenosugar biosynthesis glycosyltransferase n=1 Tax=Spartinivicinus ruber TaxID=2683272 RepID=UPI0013D33665|nr:TIGR04282 family arsenosugar biosynthesis glycosyltransferase [Spartinivicinus ruber]
MIKPSIILMAKPPIAGKVKTRLTTYYSEAHATEIYKQLLLYTAQWINELSVNWVKVLAVAEQQPHHFFDHLAFACWQRYLQQGKDLGERMANAVQQYIQPNQPVILVGGDCPGLTAPLIQQVVEKLHDEPELSNNNEVVIIPAEDGGYVLIGMRQFHPCIFENIQWGTEQVLSQTVSQLESSHIPYSLFSPLWDVDRPEDYQRWCNEY